MSSYNRVTLLGNLTRKPELKKTKSGLSVTDLGMAMNRVWTGDDGEKKEDTTFVDVVVWNRDAENAVKYLDKGRSVLVEGRLQLDTWQDAKTGQNRSKLRVVADTVQYLSSSQEAGVSGGGEPDTRRGGNREERRDVQLGVSRDLQNRRPLHRDVQG